MSLYEKLAKNKKLKDLIEASEKTLELKDEFISTGVAVLNILYSGKIDGGIPKYKISMVAGKTAQGKSFQTLLLAKQALKSGMDVMIIDTENALNDLTLKNFGLYDYVENKKLIIIPENDITAIKQIVGNLKESLDFDEKKNTLLIIDSWGGLVNGKQVEDAVSGKDVADLQTTRAKNSLAVLLNTLHPMTIFVSNHTYESLQMFGPSGGEISGGSKIMYVSSAIVKTTSEAQVKDNDGDITGKIVTAIAEKGRYVKPKTKLKYWIDFKKGINPFYNILDDALEGGYVDKPSQGWYSRPCVENDRKWREKEIWENSKEFFAPIFAKTDFKDYIEKKYSLGTENNETQELHTIDEIFSENSGESA